MTDLVQDIQTHIKQMIALRESHGKAPERIALLGMDGALDRYGIVCKDQPLPARYERGPMKQCFRNAALLVEEFPRLIYCEGYADRGLFPMHHAWCITGKGEVIDPTWDDGCSGAPRAPRGYVGVPFSLDYLHDVQNRTGHYGVFDNQFLKGELYYKGFNWKTALHRRFYAELAKRG